MDNYQDFLNNASIKDIEMELEDRKDMEYYILYSHHKRNPEYITLLDFSDDELRQALFEKYYEQDKSNVIKFEYTLKYFAEDLKEKDVKILKIDIHATDGDELYKYGDNYIIKFDLDKVITFDKVFLIPNMPLNNVLNICNKYFDNVPVIHYMNKIIKNNIEDIETPQESELSFDN